MYTSGQTARHQTAHKEILKRNNVMAAGIQIKLEIWKRDLKEVM